MIEWHSAGDLLCCRGQPPRRESRMTADGTRPPSRFPHATDLRQRARNVPPAGFAPVGVRSTARRCAASCHANQPSIRGPKEGPLLGVNAVGWSARKCFHRLGAHEWRHRPRRRDSAGFARRLHRRRQLRHVGRALPPPARSCRTRQRQRVFQVRIVDRRQIECHQL